MYGVLFEWQGQNGSVPNNATLKYLQNYCLSVSVLPLSSSVLLRGKYSEQGSLTTKCRHVLVTLITGGPYTGCKCNFNAGGGSVCIYTVWYTICLP